MRDSASGRGAGDADRTRDHLLGRQPGPLSTSSHQRSDADFTASQCGTDASSTNAPDSTYNHPLTASGNSPRNSHVTPTTDAVALLSAYHQQMLAALSTEIIAERGYQLFDDVEALNRAYPGLAWNQRKPGMAMTGYRLGVPYITIVRPDAPRTSEGKVVKYEHPARVSCYLDVLPRFADDLDNLSIPLWFTEGIKKADALASLGHPVVPVSLNGVWGWSYDGELLPDFDQIALDSRPVVIAFDSDADTNEHVKLARVRFAQQLTARGALVSYTNIPATASGEKQGLDDALAAGMTFTAICATITRYTPPPPKPVPSPRACVATGDKDIIGSYARSQSVDDVVSDLCAMGGRVEGRPSRSGTIVYCPCGGGKRHTLRVCDGRVGKVLIMSRAPGCTFQGVHDAFWLYCYRHRCSDSEAVRRLSGDAPAARRTSDAPTPANTDRRQAEAQRKHESRTRDAALIAADRQMVIDRAHETEMHRTIREVLQGMFDTSTTMECVTTKKMLADRIGMSAKTVQRAITWLEGRFIVTEVKHNAPTGKTWIGGWDSTAKRTFLKMPVCGVTMPDDATSLGDIPGEAEGTHQRTSEKTGLYGVGTPKDGVSQGDTNAAYQGDTERTNVQAAFDGVGTPQMAVLQGDTETSKCLPNTLVIASRGKDSASGEENSSSVFSSHEPAIIPGDDDVAFSPLAVPVLIVGSDSPEQTTRPVSATELCRHFDTVTVSEMEATSRKLRELIASRVSAAQQPADALVSPVQPSPAPEQSTAVEVPALPVIAPVQPAQPAVACTDEQANAAMIALVHRERDAARIVRGIDLDDTYDVTVGAVFNPTFVPGPVGPEHLAGRTKDMLGTEELFQAMYARWDAATVPVPSTRASTPEPEPVPVRVFGPPRDLKKRDMYFILASKVKRGTASDKQTRYMRRLEEPYTPEEYATMFPTRAKPAATKPVATKPAATPSVAQAPLPGYYQPACAD